MTDIQRGDLDLQKREAPGRTMEWQRTLLGWGFLLLIAALFVGGATHTGVASKLLGLAGLVMIGISIVELIANGLRSKAKGGKPASTGSRP